MIDGTELQQRMRAYGRALDSAEPAAVRLHAKRSSASDRLMIPGFAVGALVGLLVLAFAFAVRTKVSSVLTVRTSTVEAPPAAVTVGKTHQLVGGYGVPIDGAVLKRTERRGVKGVNLPAPVGSAVRSIEDAVVVRILRARTDTEYGGVELRTRDTTYLFINVADPGAGLNVGQTVAAGQIVGRVGPAASATVHLTVTIGGVTVDPVPAIIKISGLTSNLAVVNVLSDPPILVAKEVAPDLRRLLDAAERAGIELGGGGYRSSETQLRLRKSHCGSTIIDVFAKPASMCSPPTALPGMSSHERGLAVDFVTGGRAVTRGTEAFRWLKEHGAEFRFVNIPSEAWHWEYRPTSP
jgi:D-alanyl-D-alanine carboxypeptidase